MASEICDLNPCDKLARAIGHFISGTYRDGRWVVMAELFDQSLLGAEGWLFVGGKRTTVEILYCPFCGTRLEEIGAHIVKKYLSKKKIVFSKTIDGAPDADEEDGDLSEE